MRSGGGVSYAVMRDTFQPFEKIECEVDGTSSAPTTRGIEQHVCNV